MPDVVYLTERQNRAYQAVRRLGEATTVDLRDEADLPVNGSTVLMRRLMHLGLVRCVGERRSYASNGRACKPMRVYVAAADADVAVVDTTTRALRFQGERPCRGACGQVRDHEDFGGHESVCNGCRADLARVLHELRERLGSWRAVCDAVGILRYQVNAYRQGMYPRVEILSAIYGALAGVS